jgi:Fic family protein
MDIYGYAHQYSFACYHAANALADSRERLVQSRVARLRLADLSALRHVATIKSIGCSKRIEGCKLSDSGVELLLSNEMLDHKQLHPLLVTAIFIVVFLEIHPFQDGNGRLSQVLTTLLLLRSGYAYVPYSSLESVIEASKEGYYLGLRRTQGTIRSDAPAWEPWIVYFLQSLRQQKTRLEAKIARERLIARRLLELSVQILELAKGHGRITNGQVADVTGANRNTVKKHLQMLVSASHLVQYGRCKATYYSHV